MIHPMRPKTTHFLGVAFLMLITVMYRPLIMIQPLQVELTDVVTVVVAAISMLLLVATMTTVLPLS